MLAVAGHVAGFEGEIEKYCPERQNSIFGSELKLFGKGGFATRFFALG
jgi:hypothetical protein